MPDELKRPKKRLEFDVPEELRTLWTDFALKYCLNNGGSVYPEEVLGKCRGPKFSELSAESKKLFVAWRRWETKDPNWDVLDSEEANQLLEQYNLMRLASSAYSKEEVMNVENMLGRVNPRVGCGHLLKLNPFTPIEFTGEEESFPCPNCGRLVKVIVNSRMIEEVLEWRNKNKNVNN